MKKELRLLINKFSQEISLAKANGFEAVILPCCGDYDIHYLEHAEDEDYILNITYEFGWDKFALIDFSNKKSKIIDLCQIEAA